MVPGNCLRSKALGSPSVLARIYTDGVLLRRALLIVAMAITTNDLGAQGRTLQGRIAGVALWRSGALIVLRRGEQQLAVMTRDSTGIFVLSDSIPLAGRRQATTFGVSGGRIWSFDLNAGVVTITDSLGRNALSMRVATGSPLPLVFPVVEDVFGDTAMLVDQETTITNTAAFAVRGRLLLYERIRSPAADTIAALRNLFPIMIVHLRGNAVIPESQPYSASDLVGVAPRGSAFAVLTQPEAGDSSTVPVTLRLWARPESPPQMVSLVCMPRLLGEQVAQAEADSLAKRLTRIGNGSVAAAADVRRQLFVPAHWPAVLRMLVTPHGAAWLQLANGNSGTLWDYVSSNGRLHGPYGLPPGFRPLVADESVFIGVSGPRDEELRAVAPAGRDQGGHGCSVQ